MPLRLKPYKDLMPSLKMKVKISLSCRSLNVQNPFETLKDLDTISEDEYQKYPKSCRSSNVRNPSEALQNLDAVSKDEGQNHSKSCESLEVQNPSKMH